jgi:hypothetical protein
MSNMPAVIAVVRRKLRDMEDRPRLGRPKRMHTEEGMAGVHDLVCDETGGLFNTGDSELASVLCLLYNNFEAMAAAIEEPTP